MTATADTPAAPLADIGFDALRIAEVRAGGHDPDRASRVVRVDRGWATLHTATGTRRVRLRDCPHIVVGDWLVDDGAGGLVRLERRGLLVRRSVSTRAEAQEMAANVDVVLVTWALDTQVGTGRLRDMLALARESGAASVLVLSKVDTDDRVDGLLRELDGVLDGVDVLTTSVVTGEGLDTLRALTGGRTVVLLGSSGAGKSTLTNVLLGVEAQETGTVGRSGEGRHTTTARELLPIPGGGAIIDSPGIRAAAVWEDEETDGREAESPYPDLDELAEECRFSDCTHRSAPGCALARAVGAGDLDPGRLADYLDYADQRSARAEERAAAERVRAREHNRRQRP
jgi:ribosome biogenesis GTPase / thiamine phosphate phosphatase